MLILPLAPFCIGNSFLCQRAKQKIRGDGIKVWHPQS